MDFKIEQKPLFEIPPQGELIEAKGENAFEIVYRHKSGELYQGNSLEWLKSLDTETIDLIVADPPYNINKADWDKFGCCPSFALINLIEGREQVFDLR